MALAGCHCFLINPYLLLKTPNTTHTVVFCETVIKSSPSDISPTLVN